MVMSVLLTLKGLMQVIAFKQLDYNFNTIHDRHVAAKDHLLKITPTLSQKKMSGVTLVACWRPCRLVVICTPETVDFNISHGIL